MGVRIAAFEERYFAGLDALWQAVFPNDPPRNRAGLSIPKKLAVHPELLLLALDGDEVVGSVMAGYDGHRGWLYSVAVSEAHRRCGIGTLLVREAETRLREMGCVKLNLQIRAENSAVAAFYRALGFETEERVSMGKRLE